MEVYPKVTMQVKEMEIEQSDEVWKALCLKLIMKTHDEGMLKGYYRVALFDLTKSMFKSEADLVWMAKYYTVAMFKIKEITVA